MILLSFLVLSRGKSDCTTESPMRAPAKPEEPSGDSGPLASSASRRLGVPASRPYDAFQRGPELKCEGPHSHDLVPESDVEEEVEIPEEEGDCDTYLFEKSEENPKQRRLITHGWNAGFATQKELEEFCKKDMAKCNGSEGTYSLLDDWRKGGPNYIGGDKWGTEVGKFTKFHVAIFVGDTEPFTGDWQCNSKTGICQNPPNSHCGGTIIDTNTIISVAHCIFRKIGDKPVTAWIVAGVNEYATLGPFRQVRKVSGYIVPNGYAAGEGLVPKTGPMNDFLIIKLEKPLKFDSAVGRACLPPTRNYKPEKDARCFVFGWGLTHNSREQGYTHKAAKKHYPVKLRIAEAAPFLRPEACDGRCDTICGGEEGKNQCTGGKGICDGDSGGPLICEGKGGKAVLVAAIKGTGDCGAPTMYSAVAPRLRMIHSRMGTLSAEANDKKKNSRRRFKTVQFANSMKLGMIFALGGI